MCDPLMIGGMVMSAGGQFMAGQSAGASADIQERMYLAQGESLEVQAEIAGLQEGVAYQRGAFQEYRLRKLGDETLSSQTHYYASAHLDPAYGSPLLHQAITAGQVEADAEMIRATASLEAADAATRAANIQAQAATAYGNAAAADVKGDAARMAGYFGAGTALLKGFSASGASGGMNFSGSGIGGFAAPPANNPWAAPGSPYYDANPYG